MMATRRQTAGKNPGCNGDPVLNPFTVIIDNREDLAYSFSGLKSRGKASTGGNQLVVPVEWKTLQTGDYSIRGYESEVVVERKSLPDAYGTFGSGRQRWERELDRMRSIRCPNVVIEAELSCLLSRPCDACHGVGVLFEQGNLKDVSASSIQKHAKQIDGRTAAEFVRLLIADLVNGQPKLPSCERCRGTGKLHPLEHSHMSPTSVFGSIVAWQQRYPMVHWWLCPGRAAGERVTFRILEQFWNDRIAADAVSASANRQLQLSEI